jgi:hypothetical protein
MAGGPGQWGGQTRMETLCRVAGSVDGDRVVGRHRSWAGIRRGHAGRAGAFGRVRALGPGRVHRRARLSPAIVTPGPQ